MIYLFRIEDLVDEKSAMIIAEQLIDEAITASQSLRGKSQKIRICTAKIKKVQMKCASKGWTTPIDTLKSAFEMLEDARAELSVNLWGI